MKISIFLFFTVLIVYSPDVFGQGKVKPLFNSLEFASYERSNQNKPMVNFYINISSLGKINIIDKRGTDTGYYSYMLPDSTINVLNTAFNGDKTLKSYMVTNKLETGFHYAGDYSFVAFQGQNKKPEYLIYIEPFMNDSFNDTYRAIVETFNLSENKAKQAITIRKVFSDKLVEYNKKSTDLPKKELPPPEMQ